MKKDRIGRLLLGIVCGLIAVFSLGCLVYFYPGHYKIPELEVGKTYIKIMNNDNPFERPDTIFRKILNIKNGYAQFESKFGINGHISISSDKLVWFRFYEEYNDTNILEHKR